MASEGKDDGKVPVLKCSACLKDIPHSVAKSFEGQDYVHYFCGLNCRAAWEKNNKSKDDGPAHG